MMQPLKSVLSKWTSDPNRPLERDQQAMVSESLMGELEYQIKEFERIEREQEQLEKRRQTGKFWKSFVHILCIQHVH